MTSTNDGHFIRLRFVEGGGWDSRVIRWQTRCRWSHVEAIEPAMLRTFGAQLKGGVAWRNYSDACYHKAIAYKTVSIECSYEQGVAFWSFLGNQNGKPYDWRAIVSFALGERDWREEDSWFCSELIARGLEVAGLIKLPKDLPVDHLSPEHVWLLTAQWQVE